MISGDSIPNRLVAAPAIPYGEAMSREARLPMPFPPPGIDAMHPDRHVGDSVTYNGELYVTTRVERDPKTKRGPIFWAVPARP